MFRTRQYVILFLFMFVLFFLLGRLFLLQIVSFDRFSGMALEQHNRVVRIPPRRGAIYDRHMEPLAISLEAPSVYADPRRMKDREKAAGLLSAALEMDKGTVVDRLGRDKSFVWLKRKIDDDTAEKVRSLNIKGAGLLTESKRYYPNDSMAAHIIGFAGMDNEGLEGLELLYDDELKGKPGWRYLIRDARQRTVLYKEEDSIPPSHGYNIVLTIDSVVQYIAEEELKKMAEKHNAESATVIVMDPCTGRILALANYPDFDLNSFNKTPEKFIKNPAVASVFEPGSVFKIVTASAALDQKRFGLEDKIYCEKGNYRVGGRILHDFHPYGELAFRDVIAKSSNIGTVKIASTLGKRSVYQYIDRFGFGKETGIDMPGEVAGISRHPDVWSRSDISTIPIGQGIAVTPLQLACAVSVIANGGYLVKPYLVDSIVTWEGDLYKKNRPVIRERVVSESAAREMREILRAVVTCGTGRRVRSELYRMCGKTGTAQMVDPDGGYYKNKYNATFIGFAPEERPAVSIVVTAKDPHPVYFGGSVAGPAFKNIAERALQYLESNNTAMAE